MPIDPRIPLGVQPPPAFNPLELYSQIAQIQGLKGQGEIRRLQAEAEQRAARAEQALRDMVSLGPDGQPVIDYAKGLGHLGADKVLAVQNAAAELTTNLQQARTTTLTADEKARTTLGGLGAIVRASGDDQTTFELAVTTARLNGALPEKNAIQALAFSRDPAFRKTVIDDAIALAGPPKPPSLAQIQTTQGGVGGTMFVPEEAGAFYPGAPKAPTASEHSPIYREWQDYRSTGGTLTFDEYMTQDANRRRPVTQVNTGDEPIVAIIGPDGKPVYVTRSQALGQSPVRGAPAGEGGRNVTAGDARMQADYNTSRDDLSVLASAITSTGATGTAAAAGAALPKWVTDLTGWGIDAKKKQALIDRVKQVIGKTLEGGVLRKEDEVKYEKILPTIGDAPPIVISKLQGLDAAIQQRQSTHLEALADAGYDVSRFQARPARPAAIDRPPSHAATPYKVGDILTVKGQKVRVTKLLPGGKYEAVAVP